MRLGATVCGILFLLVLLLPAGCGCNTHALRGVYTCDSQPLLTLEFFPDGTWMSNSGLSGTFSQDGRRVALRGPLGLGGTAEVTRTSIALTLFGESLIFTKQ